MEKLIRKIIREMLDKNYSADYYPIDSGLIDTQDGSIQYQLQYNQGEYQLNLDNEIIPLGTEENEDTIRAVGSELNNLKQTSAGITSPGHLLSTTELKDKIAAIYQ